MSATLPCEQIAITKAIWLDADGNEIETVAAESEVSVKLETSNLNAGDTVKVVIADYSDVSDELDEFEITIEEEESETGSGISLKAVHEKFKIKKEWLLKELVIIVKEDAADKKDSEGEEAKFKADFIGARLTVLLDYVNVRIKVLDIRSGAPVVNAKVKNLKVVETDANNSSSVSVLLDKKKSATEEGFNLDDKALPEPSTANSRVKLSIQALKHLLGKSTEAKNTYTDDWKTIYEEYWEKRAGKDSGIKFPAKGNPSDNVLDIIINEYKYHRATDDEGVLIVQIPKKLLNDKRARIEVGFWNFPIIREKTDNEANWLQRTVESGNATTPVTTHFKVSWDNGANATQSLNWDNWQQGFNWFASNPAEAGNNRYELRVAEKLLIKNDTGKFESLNANMISPFYPTENNHFTLFAMQWCQPTWDGIEDPDMIAAAGVVAVPRSNNSVFVNGQINNSWVRGLNMHMVSKPVASSYDPYGHYYGFFAASTPTHRYTNETSRYPDNNRPHKGVDIYSGPNGNNPVFAARGGKLVSTTERNKTTNAIAGYAHYSMLKLTSANNPCFLYAHLSSKPTKTYVMAGEVFGNCGRTGYDSDTTSPSHLHFELLNANGNKVEFSEISSMRLDGHTIDAFNAKLFPGNKLPIMLPCQCHGSSLPAVGCNYGSNSTTVHNTCWAVREFPYTTTLLNKSSHNNSAKHPDDMNIPGGQLVRFVCPYVLNDNADKVSQLQVRLRFIIENAGLPGMPEDTYLNAYSIRNNTINNTENTNGIDGDFRETSKKWVKAVIQTYQDTLPDKDENKKIDVKISGTPDHAQLFKNRYINGSLSNNSLVDGAFDWFMGLDYANISYNTAVRASEAELAALRPLDITPLQVTPTLDPSQVQITPVPARPLTRAEQKKQRRAAKRSQR